MVRKTAVGYPELMEEVRQYIHKEEMLMRLLMKSMKGNFAKAASLMLYM